jgi:DNA invertase Pin-like site-specific DNA recombinase
MLARLTSERDVDFVIVHKVDRLARNRADDVDINLQIKKTGARLVSVAENIDETPSGILLHGIMSDIAEFYSRNLATEIIKGMSQKAKKGGWPHRAPIGYLNHQDLSEGSNRRWIEVDPARAPLVVWAFEAYASGEYTLRQLADALESKGLSTRTTRTRPSKPLSVSRVQAMLRNRFYVGMFTWNDVEYAGRHQPLVSVELFARVQALSPFDPARFRKTEFDHPRRSPAQLASAFPSRSAMFHPAEHRGPTSASMCVVQSASCHSWGNLRPARSTVDSEIDPLR